MKQTWLKLATRIDAMSLRERVIIFAMTVAILLVLVKTFLLDEQFAKADALSQQIAHDQSQIAGMQMDIQQKVKIAAEDPDAGDLLRLNQLKRQDTALHGSLNDMQKGLIPPERMNDLLQDMLRQNGKLKLVSLHTLPTVGLHESAGAVAADNGAASKNEDKAAVTDIVYKHGVEIVIEGDYRDMVDYMSALESMPWQLFWGKARLQADDHSKLTLTLRLFTLSLDKKWLNI